MTDNLDVASDREEKAREIAIENHKRRIKEQPDEDSDGNRFCLDCAEQIPPPRVALIDAVRCIDCAQIIEQRNASRRNY